MILFVLVISYVKVFNCFVITFIAYLDDLLTEITVFFKLKLFGLKACYPWIKDNLKVIVTKLIIFQGQTIILKLLFRQ